MNYVIIFNIIILLLLLFVHLNACAGTVDVARPGSAAGVSRQDRPSSAMSTRQRPMSASLKRPSSAMGQRPDSAGGMCYSV